MLLATRRRINGVGSLCFPEWCHANPGRVVLVADQNVGSVSTSTESNSPIGCLSTHHRRYRETRAVEVQRGGIEERIGFRGLRDFGVTRPADTCPSQSHGGRREETNLATTATPSPMSPACSSSAATARKTRSPNLRVDGTDNEAKNRDAMKQSRVSNTTNKRRRINGDE